MRTFLAVAALIPAALTLPGCIFGCAAWEGRGDTLYRSEAGDSVMLCANGGYAATIDNASTEGVFEWTDQVRASSPETGARTFSLATDPTTGATTSPELGAGWTVATLDKVELDHAHVMCADLETRAWWGSAYSAFLPKATAFKKVATGFATVDACFEAQAAGEYPEAALCEDELLVCPDGRAKLNQGQSLVVGAYNAQFGTLSVQPHPASFMGAFAGVFSSSGTLTSHTEEGANDVWHQVPVTEMSNGTSCM